MSILVCNLNFSRENVGQMKTISQLLYDEPFHFLSLKIVEVERRSFNRLTRMSHIIFEDMWNKRSRIHLLLINI